MRSVLTVLTLCLAAGCKGEPEDTDVEAPVDTDVEQPVDADGDGVTADLDCNDADDTVFPGAAEVCDGVDQDCDDVADDGVSTTYYADADDDGFGDPGVSEAACAPVEGYVTDASDCADADAAVNPDGTELCDEAFVDEDCDSATACNVTAGHFGGDSVATIPDATSLQTNVITIEAWVSVSDLERTDGVDHPFLRKGGVENGAGWEIGVYWRRDTMSGVYLPYFYGAFGDGTGCPWVYEALTPGEAHHFFYQVDADGLIVLGMDGTWAACGTVPFDLAAAGWDIEIGNVRADRPFGETVDEVRISRVTRYGEAFTPERHFTPDADTIALWHFDDGIGTTVTDSSGNAAHGTISGSGFSWVLEP